MLRTEGEQSLYVGGGIVVIRNNAQLIADNDRDSGDSIRTLRAALKLLLRRFGLRAIPIEQTADTD